MTAKLMFLAHRQSFSSSRQQIPISEFPFSILCFGFILHWIKTALTWVLSLSQKSCCIMNGSWKYMWKYVEMIWSNMITIWRETRKSGQNMQMILLTKDTPFVSISSQLHTLVQHGLAWNCPGPAHPAHADHLTSESLHGLWYTFGRN